MSKITNDGLTRSGTGCCTHMASVNQLASSTLRMTALMMS